MAHVASTARRERAEFVLVHVISEYLPLYIAYHVYMIRSPSHKNASERQQPECGYLRKCSKLRRLSCVWAPHVRDLSSAFSHVCRGFVATMVAMISRTRRDRSPADVVKLEVVRCGAVRSQLIVVIVAFHARRSSTPSQNFCFKLDFSASPKP